MSLKGNLAVGFGVFLASVLIVLGGIALGVVIDAAALGTIIFALNVALYWCAGWGMLGFYKTLGWGFASALIVKFVRLAKAVLS